jgi:hypothetical protein
MNCSKTGCTHEAAFYPVLTFTPQGFPDAERARLGMMLPLCEKHASHDPANYITDGAWAELCHTIGTMGKRLPDRASIEVEFKPLSEASSFMRGEPNQ